ncbi:MAG: hypothetical protein K2J71_00575 [Oscillospiraceae bacterium]|nr:hypothetical protein [Oscillospiraceae bacterium]
MQLNEILQHFENVKEIGRGQFAVNCPICGDRKRHLYLAERDGKILLDCKHGCAFRDIVEGAGLKTADFFPEKPKRPAWVFLREHIYSDESGQILAKKVIYDKGDGGKTAVWYRFERKRWIKGLNGLKVLPYHVQNLKNCQSVILAEGEKDVETIEKMGFCASCSPNGAGGKSSWVKAHNRYFKGKQVIILMDNDRAGKEHGMITARSLYGTADAVRVIPSEMLYPELKPKGDISDIVLAIGQEEAKRLLMETVRTSPEWMPTASEQPESEIRQSELEKIEKVHAEPELLQMLQELMPEQYSWDDKGMGRLFAKLFRKECRFNTTAKEWFHYNGKLWELDASSMTALQKAKQLSDALLIYAANLQDERIKSDFVKFVSKYGQLKYRSTMINDARSEYPFSREDLDKNPDLFNCQNGTYNLKTGEFYPHRSEDMLSKISNVIYDADASPELFEDFVCDIMMQNPEKIDYLQRILGYALTADTGLECCWFLYGASTRNGKGTLMESIAYMMGGTGGYAMTMNPETLARKQNKDSRQASGDIARLNGCRFLNCSEPPKNMLLDEALLKTLLGRDTITARYLHEREFEFIPQFKLFINTNHLPQVSDLSLFSSDRVNVIEFLKHYSPSERDNTLKNRLKEPECVSGMFNWCLAGLQKFRQSGAVPPASVQQATSAYRNKSDKIGRFLAECLQSDTEQRMTAKDAYEEFKDWCSQSGYGTESKGNFLTEMRTRGLLHDREKDQMGIWRNNIIIIPA